MTNDKLFDLIAGAYRQLHDLYYPVMLESDQERFLNGTGMLKQALADWPTTPPRPRGLTAPEDIFSAVDALGYTKLFRIIGDAVGVYAGGSGAGVAISVSAFLNNLRVALQTTPGAKQDREPQQRDKAMPADKDRKLIEDVGAPMVQGRTEEGHDVLLPPPLRHRTEEELCADLRKTHRRYDYVHGRYDVEELVNPDGPEAAAWISALSASKQSAMPRSTVDEQCTAAADRVVPEYRNGKRSYSCQGTVAKRWQAAWDGCCIGLGDDPDRYRW